MKRATKTTRPTPKEDAEQEHVAQLLLLVQALDHQHDDTGRGPESSLYRRLYEEAADMLGSIEPQDAKALEGLRAMDSFSAIEELIRYSGFVQGFGVCSQLLTGALQLPRSKAKK